MPSFRRSKSDKPTIDRENIKKFGKKFLSTTAISLKDNSRLRLVQRASTTTTCTEYSTRTSKSSSSYMPPTKFSSTVSAPVLNAQLNKKLSTNKEKKDKRPSFFTGDIFVPNGKPGSPEYSPRRQRKFAYDPNDEVERRVSDLLNSKKTSRKSSYNPPKKLSSDEENLSQENIYNGSSEGNDAVYKDARHSFDPATDQGKGELRLTGDNLSRHNESVGGRKKILPPPLDDENNGPPTVIYGRPKLTDFPGVGSSISSMISDITLPCILNQQ